MMSANLIVIAFVRVIQIGLAGYLFFRAYTLKIDFAVEVFCPVNSTTLNYQASPTRGTKFVRPH